MKLKTLFVGAAAVFTAISGHVVAAETRPLQRRVVDVSAQIIGGLAMKAQREAGIIDPALAALNDQLRCVEITIEQFKYAYTAWQNKQPSDSIYKFITAENAVISAIGSSALAQDNRPCIPASPKLR